MKLIFLLLSLAATIAKVPASDVGRKYLGSVKNARGQVVYHVVSHFYTVQAAKMLHGQSHLLFFDAKWRAVADYGVGVPENLPVRLKNNTLYFRPQASGRRATLHFQDINPAAAPPAWLCTGANDCYHN